MEPLPTYYSEADCMAEWGWKHNFDAREGLNRKENVMSITPEQRIAILAALEQLVYKPEVSAEDHIAVCGAINLIKDAALAVTSAPSEPAVLPHPGLPEVSAALDAVLAEYNYPANPKNAARAGWTAATRWLRAPQPAPAVPVAAEPIDMVLHCPSCGLQHIDEPEAHFHDDGEAHPTWTNPPHRSHLCHGCGHIWRPADVPTNGVQTTQTRGKDDHVLFDDRPMLADLAKAEHAMRNPAPLEWDGEVPQDEIDRARAEVAAWPAEIRAAAHVTGVLSGDVAARTALGEVPVAQPEAPAELSHICGLQGFGALGDSCPACERKPA